MSEQIRQIWDKFDQLEKEAHDYDEIMNIKAMKIQTELINMRLASMESNLGMIVRLLSERKR